MFTAIIFDAKIVDHKREGDGSGAVVEEAMCVLDREVTQGGGVLDKTIVGNYSSLGKAVHAFTDFNKDPAIVDKRLELVVGHDARRDVHDGDVHVFKAFHWSVEVEVFDVNGHETSVGSGKDTVEEEFDGGDVGGGSADFARIFDAVASNGKVDALSFFLVGDDVLGNNTKVGGFAPSWQGGVWDEVDCFSASGDAWSKALG
jgi:hypothetical protein